MFVVKFWNLLGIHNCSIFPDWLIYDTWFYSIPLPWKTCKKSWFIYLDNIGGEHLIDFVKFSNGLIFLEVFFCKSDNDTQCFRFLQLSNSYASQMKSWSLPSLPGSDQVKLSPDDERPYLEPIPRKRKTSGDSMDAHQLVALDTVDTVGSTDDAGSTYDVGSTNEVGLADVWTWNLLWLLRTWKCRMSSYRVITTNEIGKNNVRGSLSKNIRLRSIWPLTDSPQEKNLWTPPPWV